MKLFIVVAAIALLASPLSAQPLEKQAEKKAEKSEKKKAAQKAATKATKKPAAEKKKVRRIDLFPESVLGPSRRTPEKRRRLTLGDDSDWRVQAAQVGAMAAIFGTLAALCNGGKCMIPDAATQVLPSWMRAQQPFVPNPRPPQKLRQIR